MQNDLCEDVDDKDVISQMPGDYWLRGTNTRCLLACMVHRTNKEIAATCASPQRINAAARVTKEREDAREARKRSMDYDRSERRIRTSIGEMSVIKSRNDIVATQLRLYNDNKDSFIAAMGEDAYNNKIIELLGKLPDPSSPSVGGGVANDDDDEDSGSDM
jgi:argininosuccinate lyase